MQSERSLLWRMLCLLLAIAIVATACGSDDGDDDGDAASDAAETVDEETSSSDDDEPAGDLTGEFLVSGSSTVFPIVNKQAEEFGAANPGVAIAVEGPGSGDGAKLFCAGDIPIGNASRRYKDSELEECAANGIEFIELRRAIDGISVITSAENDAIDCLSFDALYALISEEAIGFTSWADANELLADMGSSAPELPDAPLDIYAPGEESGTFDSFVEIVIEEVAGGDTGLDADAREFLENARPDYNSSPDDNIIIEGISGNQFSLGWVGFAFAKEAADAGEAKLIDVEVAPGDGCVTPTPESIAAAEFPIARFLYTYVNADWAAEEPAVEAFVDYMMSDTGLESVTAVGYIDLSDADQAKAQDIWANRTTGVQWDVETAPIETGGDEGAAPADLTGEFLVSGSSTVFPIVNKQAEEFGAANPGVAIAVEGPGSGDGAKLFCAGDIPIGNASRKYKDSELEECAANGIEFIELRRGIDGISVITSASNDAIECLSFDHLYALLSDEAIGFTSWADANDLLADMGSAASELPDAPLDIYAPGEESGTFDSFGEIVMEEVAGGDTGLDADAREFVETIRPDYNSSPDDNIIIEGIAGNQFSLGWVGFAFASEAAEAGEAKLIDIEVAPGDGCVTPTPESIAAAEFPISRFLYTYVNAEWAANEPAVAAFVDYMMSDTGLESVTAVGYIDLSADDQALAQDIWANRTTGRQWD